MAGMLDMIPTDFDRAKEFHWNKYFDVGRGEREPKRKFSYISYDQVGWEGCVGDPSQARGISGSGIAVS